MDAVRVCTGPSATASARATARARAGARARRRPVLAVPCLGHCDLAPVLMRGDDVERRRHAPDERRLPRSASSSRRDARRLRGARRAARRSQPAGQRRIVEELQASGLAGYGRRRLPDRAQVGRPSVREPAPRVRGRQRRRGRAGDDQRPLRDGAAPAPPARGRRCSRCASRRRPRASSTCARSTRPLASRSHAR